MAPPIRDVADGSNDSCVVTKFAVEGFWKSRRIECALDGDVNFIIGPNGSGKTTIVNLLAAILTADFRTLDRVEFSEARVCLRYVNSPDTGYDVVVVKARKDSSPFPSIDFDIRDVGGMSISSFSLDEVEEQMLLRDPRYRARGRSSLRNKVFSETLGRIVDVNWLSVQRHDGLLSDRPDAVESFVDLKIESQSNLLVRFFSRLEQQATEVLNTFQQSVFLSLLLGHEHAVGFWDAQELNRETERQRIVPILDGFGVQKSRYVGRLEKHLEAVEAATQKVRGVVGLEDKDVVSLVNQKRISEVVSEWESYQIKRSLIFKLRDKYLATLNSMLLGKQVYISSTNELAVRSLSGGALPIRSLSSGEKQLMIILGQALLQDSKPVVYIADEPELSLHVAWQERLVDALRDINPFAQIVFATHSPDIVARYVDKVREARDLFLT